MDPIIYFNNMIKRYFSSAKKTIQVRDALKQAMVEEMHRDEKVYLIGEEVG